MKVLKAKNIKWDTEVDGVVASQDELGLPSEVVFSEDINDEVIADRLSDEYGYCVESFASYYEEQDEYIVMYCYEREMMLIGKATTYEDALKIMEADFFKVFEDQIGTKDDFRNEEGLNDTWWFASEIGEAWINGKGNHDWEIIDISRPSIPYSKLLSDKNDL